MIDPAAAYAQRLQDREQRLARLRARHRALVWARIVELFLALCVAYVAFAERKAPVSVAWSAFALFGVLTGAIVWVEELIVRREAVVRYYQRGVARLDERWMEGAVTGDRFADEAHPYADDLDLFGSDSLYGLLCVARTATGQETLARWLTEPAPAAEARSRQEGVRELAGRVDLRERLWQAGGVVEGEVEQGALLAWVEAPARRASAALRLAALAGGAAGVAAAWLLASGRIGPALIIFAAQVVFATRLRALTADVVRTGAQRARELRTVVRLVGQLEGARFTSPRLAALEEELTRGGLSSRRRLGGLIRLVNALEARRNALFALITAPLLLGTQLALAIEAWRARHGEVIARWVRAVGTVEALSSLATYAYEHPADPFPTLLDDDAGPRFAAEGLAHPLLPRATRKANDLALGEGINVLIVTGSNMSGKTTLLRTVGINAVLALAGAPVCAGSLRLSSLQVGASLRTRESLHAGVSRFYGEIRRLRTIVELAERSRRTLFLIDEMLHGTNSHDRQRGGEAVLRQLAGAGCIGLVTTHDLSLARLAELPELHAGNVHFQDRIEDGALVFDYQMRPGIASRSNALDLMRLVGLNV